MILKKVLFPVSSTALLTFSVTAASEDKKDEEKNKEKELVRRKDLSLYPEKKEEGAAPVQEEAKPDSALMSVVKQSREAVWSVNKQLQGIVDSVNHVVETGKAHASSSVQILREEENYVQRYGAITAGGLVGYIIAIRRGWFRKIVYTATGASAVAAIVYPEEAKEISTEAFQLAKQYIVIAYHFINGDKNQGNSGKKSSSSSSKPKKEKSDKGKSDKEKSDKEITPQPVSFVSLHPRLPVAE